MSKNFVPDTNTPAEQALAVIDAVVSGNLNLTDDQTVEAAKARLLQPLGLGYLAPYKEDLTRDAL